MKALLLIYTLGSLIDYATTAWALARNGTEKNPLGAYLIAEHGIEYLLYFKIGALIVYVGGWWLMMKFDKILTELWNEPCEIAHWMAFASIWAVALGQWLVVAHNLGQMMGL